MVYNEAKQGTCPRLVLTRLFVSSGLPGLRKVKFLPKAAWLARTKSRLGPRSAQSLHCSHCPTPFLHLLLLFFKIFVLLSFGLNYIFFLSTLSLPQSELLDAGISPNESLLLDSVIGRESNTACV